MRSRPLQSVRGGHCAIAFVAQGQATDIEIQAKEILFLRERLNSLLADHTGQPIDVIERDTERDRFMSAEQSVEYGLVDEVISTR